MLITNVVNQLTRHPTKRWETRSGPPDVFCVHHSATDAGIRLEQIARYHVNEKDMPSIQYHYCITAAGDVFQVQPDSAYVWHGHDWNTGLGVCLLGDFTSREPPEAQLAAARWLLTEKRREYGALRLVGHGEAPRASTECPGRTWPEWKHKLEAMMAMSRKIGLHQIASRKVALGKPTIFKWIDPSPGDLAEASAETGPECLFVVRFYQKDEPLDNPERRAEEWVARHKDKALALKAVHSNIIFEGYNEVGDTELELHARFEIRRLALMHALGLRVGVLSSGVGNPNEKLWPKLRSMLAAMWPDDVVCLHEYWRDTGDVDNNWHVTRFRYHGIWEHVKGRMIAITECGRDVLYDLVPQGSAGWKKTCGPDEFMRDLRRAGELYDAIPEVIGATVFQSGAIDPTWKDFDVTEIWPRVVAEYAGAPVTPPIKPPVTPPTSGEYLPSNDPFTLAAVEGGDLPTMQDKIRWWTEEAVRQLEAGNGYGLRIMQDMVRLDGGLMYEAENAAKQ